MAYTYEIILAPSEEVSKFAASRMGTNIESAICSDYLHATGAPLTPGGSGPVADFFDTGVAGDYIKMMVERHPAIDEKQMRADSRIRDALPIPDISTQDGKFLPRRFLGGGGKEGRVEDTSRSEFYEIKPNSETGERDGRAKLEKIEKSYVRYGIPTIYTRGRVYPSVSPTYIPLTWSEAFEYLRLVFMWEHNLRQCDIDLQLLQLPDSSAQGLLLYAFRIRLALDTELAKEKARALAAGICFAMALCAVAGILELAADLVAGAVAESLLEALKKLAERGVENNPLPPFEEVPKGPRIGPRIAPQPEPLPELDLEPDDARVLDDEVLPAWQKGLAAAVLGRAYLVPRKKMDIFCDEDFFMNVVFDESTARRFVQMTRLALPMSSVITVTSGLLRIAVAPFVPGLVLQEQIERRLPNRLRLRIGERIPEALARHNRTPGAGKVTIVSQVLIQTPIMAAFIEPTLRSNAGKSTRAGSGLGRGKIALPPEILARWKARNGATGAPARPPTMEALINALLPPNGDQRNRQYLKDALAGADKLKVALGAAPGFTLAIGVHALYAAPSGEVTPENRYGTLLGVNLSRLFGVTVREGAAPPGDLYQELKPASVSEETLSNAAEAFRYMGRMKVKG